MNVNIEEQLLKEIHEITIGNEHKKMKNKKILVLSGGGIKGIAHLGGLYALYQHNYLQYIKTIAGTSIGALIGTLLIIDYTPQEMYEFILGLDFSKMASLNIMRLLEKGGLDDGNKIIIIIKKLFKNKNISTDITLKELYNKTEKELIIVTTCINTKKIHYLSYKTTPNLSVIKALRMSISVPIYFTPVNWNDHLYIDGGCMDNYPIRLFDDILDDVIGIFLSDNREQIEKIDNFENILIHIFYAMIEGNDFHILKGYENHTIKINLSNVSLMDLTIDKNKKIELFNIGYNEVMKYIN